jgi:hypothetical protein
MSIVLLGSTSGSITLQEPAVAGTNTLSLPAVTATLATEVNGVLYPLSSGTAVASTSGTSIDFTGIPSWVKRITVMFSGVSTSGSSLPLIQLGDSGGIENTGYTSTGTRTDATGSGASTSTAGIVISSLLSTNVLALNATFCLISANSWVCDYSGASSSQSISGGGSKTLSDVLDRIRITTVNGTDTFDAGSINILYE